MDEFNIGPLLDMAFDESEAKANDMSLNFVIMLMLNRWLPGVSAMMPIAAGVAVIAFGKILFSRG